MFQLRACVARAVAALRNLFKRFRRRIMDLPLAGMLAWNAAAIST
jgi:hypothetical protein